jgi:hypothetical protein
MSWRTWTLLGFGLLVVATVAGRVAFFHWRHSYDYDHRAPLGLHADVIMRGGSIGIPGVTKTYETELNNRGFLPARVTRCEFVDDAGGRGTMIAYAVERWDRSSKRWKTVVDLNNATFCKPYSLGIVWARVTTKWLWPGQSLTTGEEATAARGPFEKETRRGSLSMGRRATRSLSPYPLRLFESMSLPSIEAGAFRVRH